MADATCWVEDCDHHEQLRRGLCAMHYQRMRTGKLDIADWPPARTGALPFLARISAPVPHPVLPTPCLPRDKGVLNEGYSPIVVGGKWFGAHRWIWIHHHGPVPPGFEVDHIRHNVDPECEGGESCPHRCCVEISHLRCVPKRENVRAGKGITSRRGVAARRAAAHAKRLL